MKRVDIAETQAVDHVAIAVEANVTVRQNNAGTAKETTSWALCTRR